MTQLQAEKQIEQMIKDLGILEECKRLLKSGAIAVAEDSINDYSHTKVVLKVALENVASEIRTYSKEIEADYKNLQNF